MPSRLKLHSSMNSTCAESLVVQPVVKNRHVADGRLLLRRDHAAHDRVAESSCGSHLWWRIHSLTRLWLLLKFTQHMFFKFMCRHTPITPCVVHPTDK
ncbi:hypothetical protein TNCV_3795241 [Trichonephila clavipes]|nr:hypothetical protein TNCV_3795241 [Trichonephila clavipes]